NAAVQLTLKKSADLPDSPGIMEFAKTDAQQQILKLVLSRQNMARPFAAPPGIPLDRAKALRRGFEDTLHDLEFLEEAKARGLEANPGGGGEIDKLIDELYKTPPAIIAEAKAAVAPE